MALRTRCITAQKVSDDGVRISVMSGHIVSDGSTHIPVEAFDEWWRVLAPPPKLAWLYHKNVVPWDEFAGQYNGYLASQRAQSALRRLIKLARQGNVTILCVEEIPEYCHRRLMAQACQWLDPTLEVLIK